jgi:hypothetical protein
MVRHPMRGFPALLLTALVAAPITGDAQQPGSVTPRSPSPLGSGAASPPASSMITGRVFGAADGAPLRGAEVRATFGQGEIIRVLLTDAQGRFEIGGLVPGRWSVTAAKAGYVRPRPENRNVLQPLKTVELAAAQRQTLDFAMVRGSAISGHVYDEQGAPVAGVRIEA